MISLIRNKFIFPLLLLVILTVQIYGGEQYCTNRLPSQHFVLVHGAWHGAWCWSKVANFLEKMGHTVTVLDLPAHGIDMNAAITVTLNDYAQKIVTILDASAEPVILVGHSMSGAAISMAAEARPDKIAKLVYLAAFMVASGQTLLEVAGQDTGSMLLPELIPNPAEGYIDVNRGNLANCFYNTSPDFIVNLARTLIRPEPMFPAVTPLVLTAARYGSVPRYYIKTLQDHAISPAAQERMIAAQPCAGVYSIYSDHSPFFSKPLVLCQILNRIARD
jgi:pimeloyl-ACP methyl ester carboxylesterase